MQFKPLCKMRLLVFIVMLFLGEVAVAAENVEIEFLLSFITNSDCTFIRNGKNHRAEEASDHLRKKYSHVKSRINTAEDFIDKIASKSSLSGRPYIVSCINQSIPTKQWLREALANHRRLESAE